jgi:hypothetical protein
MKKVTVIIRQPTLKDEASIMDVVKNDYHPNENRFYSKWQSTPMQNPNL